MSATVHHLTVSVGEFELDDLLQAFDDLCEGTLTEQTADFASGIMGQMIMRLEAKGKLSGPSLYSPEITINKA